MEDNKWLFEQCMKCRHLVTRTSMRTGRKTYACDGGAQVMTVYDGLPYVGEGEVVVPSRSMCDTYVERFVASLNRQEND